MTRSEAPPRLRSIRELADVLLPRAGEFDEYLTIQLAEVERVLAGLVDILDQRAGE